MRYEALISFYTAVREKSFTAAARKLFLTQPAVSMAIKQLETEFGQPLLERRPGGKFELTTLGEQVYHVVKNINFQMEKLELIKEKNVAHEIAIECNTIAGFYLISSLTSNFQNVNPDIYVNIKLTQDPIQSILEGKTDLVMLLTSNQLPPNQFSHLKTIMSWEDQHEIIVSESHSFAGNFVSKQDLVQLPFILAPRRTPYRQLLDETLSEQLGSNLNCRVELNNPEAVKRSVLSLNLPGIVARSTVISELKDGTLFPILNDLDMGCQHILALKKHGTQTNAMRNFTNYITSSPSKCITFPKAQTN